MRLVLRMAGGRSGAHHTKTCEVSHKAEVLVHLAVFRVASDIGLANFW
jgi:hypothetical protein